MESVLAHVSFQVAGGWPVALLVLTGLLALAVLGSRGLRVQGRRRVVLIGLRWLTALLLAVLVAQPTWQIERTRLLAGKVAVLFDDSASLGWWAPGERRIDRAQELLSRWSQEFAETDGSRARFYRVTSEVAPLQTTDGQAPHLSGLGTQSRLWAGLKSLAEEPWQPSSLVLVSDGADSGDTPYGQPRALSTLNRQPARPYLLAKDRALHLVWKEFDGQKSLVRWQASSDSGRQWSPARTVAETADASDHPLLVADAKHVYLSWLTKVEGYRLIPLEDQP